VVVQPAVSKATQAMTLRVLRSFMIFFLVRWVG
jgi:hypothetical protein